MSRNEETRLCLGKGHKSSAATVTLLAVSFYLIFTTLPVTVCYALQFNFDVGPMNMTMAEIEGSAKWQRHFRFFAIRKIVEEIGMSHFACNFFIYILTGKLFRLELRLLSYQLFCKDKMRRWRSKQYNGFDRKKSMLLPQPTLGVITPVPETITIYEQDTALTDNTLGKELEKKSTMNDSLITQATNDNGVAL